MPLRGLLDEVREVVVDREVCGVLGIEVAEEFGKLWVFCMVSRSNLWVIYSVANALFSWAWDLWGPPQFTGSLLPRPSDLGGLGTSPIGIPNQNLGLQQVLGRPLTARVPSPGSLRP